MTSNSLANRTVQMATAYQCKLSLFIFQETWLCTLDQNLVVPFIKFFFNFLDFKHSLL